MAGLRRSSTLPAPLKRHACCLIVARSTPNLLAILAVGTPSFHSRISSSTYSGVHLSGMVPSPGVVVVNGHAHERGTTSAITHRVQVRLRDHSLTPMPVHRLSVSS